MRMTHATGAGTGSEVVVWWRKARSGAPKVVAVPHAGAGAGLFFPWVDVFESVALGAVRLPGREGRIDESPFVSLDEIADEIVVALGDEAERQDNVLFGHCSGAILALEVARRLSDHGGCRALVVASPSELSADVEKLQSLPIRELLERLGHTDSWVLDNIEIMKLLEPALRADIAATTDHKVELETPLSIPLDVVFSRESVRRRDSVMDVWNGIGAATRVSTINSRSFFDPEGWRSLAACVHRIAEAA